MRIIVIQSNSVNKKFEFFMIFLKRLLLSLFALLMLAMLAAYLIPLNVYIPELERTLGARLQVPVRVGSLRASMLPLPHLELRDVLLGGQDGIALRSVDVSPDLLAGRLAMHVEVRDGAAHMAQMSRLAAALSGAPVVERGLTVRELWFSDLILLAPEMAVGPLEGKLEFSEAGTVQRAWFAQDEQKLTVVFSSLPDRHFAVKVRAGNWIAPQLPRLSKLPIDDLQLDGVLGREYLLVQQFSLISEGLRVEGAGRLNFSNRLELHAQLRKAEVPLERLMALLGKPVGLTGLLSGKGKLDSCADSWEGLAEGAHFVGDLRLTDVTARVSESFKRPLAVDSIRSHVVLHSKRLDLSNLQARLYGGSLSGEVGLDRKKSALNARLVARDIDMRPLVEALTNEVLFTGRMESQTRLLMNLDRLDRFPENLKLAGEFHLRDGTVSKVDLAQVVSNSGKTATSGGVTRFSDLTGAVRVDASGYHFGELKISSGSLNADGRIDMTPLLQLNGTLDLDLKGTSGLMSVPLVISGTLEQPEVSVSRAAMAGAAVGTAVLGPGLGTALGSKLGVFMNKLLGSRAKPEPHATR